jgi:prevent-host-death family protein
MGAEPAERVNVSGVRELPIAEARSRLAELIDAVSDGEFIYLTRRGKRVAALLASDIAEHYEQIEDDYWARRAAEAHDHLRAHPAATMPWQQVIAELEGTGQ